MHIGVMKFAIHIHVASQITVSDYILYVLIFCVFFILGMAF